MKFIVDAQLPWKLKRWLIDKGHNTIHVEDLPLRNLTSDIYIINLAEREKRTVITKDSDFLNYHLIHQIPKKILLITTGNIVNRELFELFEINFDDIINLFNTGTDIVEINNESIITR